MTQTSAAITGSPPAGYAAFLQSKQQQNLWDGFDPVWMPDFLFPFQAALVEWAVRKGRGAIFADCGMGKTPMGLTWGENVVRKTNRRVLIATPIAVGGQMVREAEKFGIDVARSRDGKLPAAKIVITNYENLHKFDPRDFVGFIGDESSILKNFDGRTKAAVTEFARTLPYRLLETATAAPNDFIELGTSSEALGYMGYMDMLGRFFKNDQNIIKPVRRWTEQKTGWASQCAGGGRGVWRFRGHAEHDFWRWVCSWARAIRKPSDMGFPDGDFVLPPLETLEHVVHAATTRDGELFERPALTLSEQRDERRRTLQERCEKAAELAAHSDPVVAWCHLNAEGDLLEKLIPGAVQVSGSDSDEAKEEAFTAFSEGKIRCLVSKPVIAGFGMNWQHCAHQTFFPSHSFEQWYQAIRRSWRFGQKRTVRVDLITSEGESGVLANMQRKAEQSEEMFGRLVSLMHDELAITRPNPFINPMQVPQWLS